MTVDWTKPLVVVDTETGERVEVELVGGPDREGDYITTPVTFGCDTWSENGENWSHPDRYRIENSDQEPPVWALKEACKRAGLSYSAFQTHPNTKVASDSIRAHALTIAKHEDQPLDPLGKAVDEAFAMLPPEWDRKIFVESVSDTLRRYGVEAKAGEA